MGAAFAGLLALEHTATGATTMRPSKAHLVVSHESNSRFGHDMGRHVVTQHARSNRGGSNDPKHGNNWNNGNNGNNGHHGNDGNNWNNGNNGHHGNDGNNGNDGNDGNNWNNGHHGDNGYKWDHHDRHCGDGHGRDHKKNKHCRPPSGVHYAD
ncbi:MAG: hypothetical protein U0V73_07680 [Acidimicrobiia bacterium]